MDTSLRTAESLLCLPEILTILGYTPTQNVFGGKKKKTDVAHVHVCVCTRTHTHTCRGILLSRKKE